MEEVTLASRALKYSQVSGRQKQGRNVFTPGRRDSLYKGMEMRDGMYWIGSLLCRLLPPDNVNRVSRHPTSIFGGEASCF